MRMPTTRPSIHCADGTRISVQASSSHYCSPLRDDLPLTSYTQVEVWQPSDENGDPVDTPATWTPFYDGDGLYAYIPYALVVGFINDHGGYIDELSNDTLLDRLRAATDFLDNHPNLPSELDDIG